MNITYTKLPAKYLAEDASDEDKAVLKAIQEMVHNLNGMYPL